MPSAQSVQRFARGRRSCEIDINPLVVLAAGEGVIALDALIVSDS